MTVDYAHTRKAEENREKKAGALAAAARRLSVPAAGLAVGTGNRRRVWKEAGLAHAPSVETWHVAVQMMGEGEPPAAGPRPRSCVYHPDRPGRLYLEGWRCDPCSPWARRTGSYPTPPPGTTLDDLRAARPPAVVIELDTRIEAAKRHADTAAARARVAEVAHRKYGHGEHARSRPP
ncbi:hypothetical protein [Cellulomonas sp. HZM]|uniref:hypothetical protein n=1 Tax=Cellulomonas sp. HZM TaxID=1454010 RepID=UPI0004931EE1|nr:hypothetical protein [Cellulomonas sp. HZM]